MHFIFFIPVTETNDSPKKFSCYPLLRLSVLHAEYDRVPVFSDRLLRIRLCFIPLKLIDRIFPMAKSLAQLKKQIAALERQADAIKQKETKDVVARIKEAIAFYDLSAEQLGLVGAKRPGRKPGAAKTGRKSAASGRKRASKVKYRDDAGNSWSGHGRRPKWFLDALAGGKTAQDLSV